MKKVRIDGQKTDKIDIVLNPQGDQAWQVVTRASGISAEQLVRAVLKEAQLDPCAKGRILADLVEGNLGATLISSVRDGGLISDQERMELLVELAPSALCCQE